MPGRVLLAHGSGGKMARDLIERVLVPHMRNPLLQKLDDSAVFSASGRLAFTTDSYVVRPIFFPGGDIGRLAVCGTVNDLSMVGARPMYLSLSFIIEEGLLLQELERVVHSISEAAYEAEVQIVTGDTKVVDKGSADKLFVNTAGVGIVPDGVDISGGNARPGDVVILSGPIGDHGMAVMGQREGLGFSSDIESDVAPLNHLVQSMLAVSRRIRVLRDPTRGGLASTLNEIARQSRVGMEIEEDRVPVRDSVRAACEMLGLDPLYVANEGKLVAVVPPEDVYAVLKAMREHRYGGEAAIIGEVRADEPGRVVMRTSLGTSRIVDMLTGEPLPRIC